MAPPSRARCNNDDRARRLPFRLHIIKRAGNEREVKRLLLNHAGAGSRSLRRLVRSSWPYRGPGIVRTSRGLDLNRRLHKGRRHDCLGLRSLLLRSGLAGNVAVANSASYSANWLPSMACCAQEALPTGRCARKYGDVHASIASVAEGKQPL
jgi:hypothetical protein